MQLQKFWRNKRRKCIRLSKRNSPGLSKIIPNGKLFYPLTGWIIPKELLSEYVHLIFFLEKYPEYREKVQLVMLAVPSRTGVEQYQLLKKEIDELVGRINSKYATPEWSPILYLFRSLDFENLVQLYAGCDVALLTPVRDG